MSLPVTEQYNEGIKFGNIEYEDDRPIKHFEFNPIPLEEALNSGALDLVSRLATSKEVLYILLAISNFAFSGAELRNQTALLADSLGEKDEEPFEMLERGTLISAATLNKYNSGILEKHNGVVTYSSNGKRHQKYPVYSVANSEVFMAAIIAAKLLHEKPFGFALPEKYMADGHSNFKQQVTILNSLQYFGEMNRGEIERLVNDQPDSYPTTSRLILDPLITSKLIEREDEYVFIERDNLKPDLFIDSYLIELLGDNTNTVLTYSEFREYLEKKAFEDSSFVGQLSDIKLRKKLTSAIKNFKDKGRGEFVMDWSCKVDNDPGYSNIDRRYRLTKDGESFLNMIRSFFENPDSSLGPASSYSLYDIAEDQIKTNRGQFSNYSKLLTFVLQRLFK